MRLVRGAAAPLRCRQRFRVDDDDIEPACTAQHVFVERHRQFRRAHPPPGNRNSVHQNARAGHEIESGDRQRRGRRALSHHDRIDRHDCRLRRLDWIGRSGAAATAGVFSPQTADPLQILDGADVIHRSAEWRAVPGMEAAIDDLAVEDDGVDLAQVRDVVERIRVHDHEVSDFPRLDRPDPVNDLHPFGGPLGCRLDDLHRLDAAFLPDFHFVVNDEAGHFAAIRITADQRVAARIDQHLMEADHVR